MPKLSQKIDINEVIHLGDNQWLLFPLNEIFGITKMMIPTVIVSCEILFVITESARTKYLFAVHLSGFNENDGAFLAEQMVEHQIVSAKIFNYLGDKTTRLNHFSKCFLDRLIPKLERHENIVNVAVKIDAQNQQIEAFHQGGRSTFPLTHSRPSFCM